MKIVNWNIEWMNDWFTPISAGPPGRRAANPLGPTGRGTQRLCVLVKKGGRVEAASRVWPRPDRIDYAQSWPVDVVGDLILEGYEFTREPLEVELIVSGRPVLLVNLHSKSKYILGGWSLWDNEATRPQFIAQAVRNRRRIAAELMRVRMALDERLEDDAEVRIVVADDLNDGPGVDSFEEHYLIHNVVAVVSGNPFNPRRMLRHAFIDRELRDRNWTARFDDFIDGISDRPLLLDHILLAPSMYWGPFRNARIEHEAFEAQIDRRASGRMRDPSDHRPQSVTLEFG